MTSSEPAKRPPCATHGLATGPDGRCALCRRSQPPHTPLPVAVAGDGLGSRAVTRLLGLALLLAAGGTGAYAYTEWQSASSASQAAAAAEALPRRGRPPQAKPAASERAVKPPQAGAQAELPAQPAQLEQQLAAAQRPQALSPEEAERLRQRELDIAEQDRRRTAQIEADRQARAQRRAREGLTVTLYATSWCKYCKAAREYMTAEKIAFVEHDIDASESAKLIMKRLNPRGGVPTFDIDGTILVGFSSAELDATLEAAVEKRAARSR